MLFFVVIWKDYSGITLLDHQFDRRRRLNTKGTTTKDTIRIHLEYLEMDRPKPVLNNFNKKVVKPKVSFSILPTNIPIPWHRQDTAQF